MSRDIVFCPAISFFVPLKTKMASDCRIDGEIRIKILNNTRKITQRNLQLLKDKLFLVCFCNFYLFSVF